MNAGRCVGCVLLATAALSLAGCSAGSVAEIGLFGSYMDSDDLGDGYGGGASLQVKPIDVLGVEARASWLYFEDFEVHMIPLEGALRLNLPLLGERLVPYVGVGGGYYIFEADDVDLDDDFGYFPLVGLAAGFRRVALFGEARWVFLETDVDSALEGLDNIDEADIDGLGVNVGLLFRF